MSQPEFNLLFVIQSARRWRRWIIGLTLLTAVVAVVSVLLVDNYYRARCVVMPYSPRTSDPRTLFFDEAVYEVFGDKMDVDRVIGMGLSDQTIRRVMDEHKLQVAWNIDTTKAGWRDKLMERWKKKVTVQRNDQAAVEILVIDTDAEMAAKVANSLAWQMNVSFKDGIMQNNWKELSVYKQNNTDLQGTIAGLSKQLDSLLNLNPGVVMGEKGLVTGARSPQEAARIRGLTLQLGELNEALAENIRRTKQVESALKGDINTLLIVQKAEKPELKYGPQRTITVLAATIAGFFLLLILAVGLEFYRATISRL